MKDVFACENPICVSPTLARMCGLETAIFLEKFHCWLHESQKTVDGQRWLEGNFDAWGKELLFMAPRTMRRIVKQLLRLGLMEVSQRDGGEWYTLAYTELEKQVAAYRAKHGTGNPFPMAAEGGDTL